MTKEVTIYCPLCGFDNGVEYECDNWMQVIECIGCTRQIDVTGFEIMNLSFSISMKQPEEWMEDE